VGNGNEREREKTRLHRKQRARVEIKEKGGELGKELNVGYVSCIVKMHYWQPYRLPPPTMSRPPLAS